MRAFLRLLRVDDEGLLLVAVGDRPVDVCFDGRRVWTFWVVRDAENVAAPVDRGPWPIRRAVWPTPLRRRLNGRSRVTVKDSVTGQVFYDRTISLGDGDGAIEVRNRDGLDVEIDKSGRLVPTFAGRSTGDIDALLDATEAVLAALVKAGIEPFLAYGTLLGAVREGKVLGHDSDADLGYVSRFSDPVDVARESFDVQRRLAAEGWQTSRYSGGSFKVMVTEGDVTRGLDVFGGFLSGERLYLMGEIGVPFDRSWIYPLGTATLGGRSMPVPARPERLLEATYGAGWRVPDPAFKFTTPGRTVRAFDEWFRGIQTNIRYWQRRSVQERYRRRPSSLAIRARAAATRLGAEVLDVGAGRGGDSLWLARNGIPVIAYDFVLRGLERPGRIARRNSLPLEVRYLNLGELRSVLAEGARLAQRPGPRIVLARHVVDATSAPGREALARLCSMALRDGGRLLAEFHLRPEDADPAALEAVPWLVGRPDVEALTASLRRAGARTVRTRMLPGGGLPTVRVVAAWD